MTYKVKQSLIDIAGLFKKHMSKPDHGVVVRDVVILYIPLPAWYTTILDGCLNFRTRTGK